MTEKQLINDLNRRCPDEYFEKGEDVEFGKGYWKRRTFNDMLAHYSKYGVTAELLMTALYNAGFAANICSIEYKTVWHKAFSQGEHGFWGCNKMQTSKRVTSKSSYPQDHATEYHAKDLDELFAKLKLKPRNKSLNTNTNE